MRGVRADEIDHGTYRGYQKCRRRKAGSCDDCRTACSIYMQNYRASHPGQVEFEARKAAARDRALRVLAHRHQDEFREIVAEEWSKE